MKLLPLNNRPQVEVMMKRARDKTPEKIKNSNK